jgi:predicted kinase
VSASPHTELERRPTMVVVGGPPGSGKTTVAAALARVRGWTVIRSEAVRREVVGGQPWSGPPEWLAARFSPAETERTYHELVRRARALLETGQSVVLDATWSTEAEREIAETAAKTTGSAFVALQCQAPPHVAERRVGRRIAGGEDIRSATVAIVRRIAQSFVPWPQARIIDSGAPLAETLDIALREVELAAADGGAERGAGEVA